MALEGIIAFGMILTVVIVLWRHGPQLIKYYVWNGDHWERETSVRTIKEIREDRKYLGGPISNDPWNAQKRPWITHKKYDDGGWTDPGF